MGLRFARAALLLLMSSIGLAAEPTELIEVWLDVDTATGIGDVDDGLMLIQSFHSPEIKIRGISVVFGNAPLDKALPIARTITGRFGPAGIMPKPGAAAATDFGKRTEAVEALAAELDRGLMTIVAVGPVTNVGTVVKLYPKLHDRIERIIMVAGRRPNQRFVTNEKQRTPHRDFNFELDPAAMRAILDTKIPLVFAPWEVSSHVWVSRDDLESLRNSGGSGAWIAETSQYWIERWEKNIDTRGFNPFDTLAMGWLTHPSLIESARMQVVIEEGPNDRLSSEGAEPKVKPYLVVQPFEGHGREAIYCFLPRPTFKPVLMERLSGRH
ncbi:MAG: nucleoside hydrolase [Planctomycetia bacterium]|nr:nucleoside hydrolase [Planctomycetia bacterium]